MDDVIGFARNEEKVVGLSELERFIMGEAISGVPVSVSTCAELFPKYGGTQIQRAIIRLANDIGYLKPVENCADQDEFTCYEYDRRGPRRLRKTF